MTDRSIFAELSERISSLAPIADNLREDLRTKMEQTLRQGLDELDVVSRDDFEAQQNALQRAQQRIEKLETTLRELESRMQELESGGS